MGLLDEVGYHLLVALAVFALSENLEHTIERSGPCTFAVLRVEIDGLVAERHCNLVQRFGNDYGLYCRRKLYGCATTTTYHFALCIGFNSTE